ncbi:UNVERIFIED_CONTAM: hypothetical protein FKN15_027546 [Acipenser sinensis]
MAERVLVIGSGGREHSLAWKLAQSPLVQQVLVAPGNAGTADNGKISNSGMVDDLTAAGVCCFGPSAKAAQLEASKSFSKEFMDRHGIPTARWRAFTDPQEACRFIQSAEFRALVVKASGLAAGKGVIVAEDKDQACRAVWDIMQDKTFGAAGETVVVEELLEGEEVSCLCFSDGSTVAPMPPAQDHKRLLDGDLGPNTGGMGAYCPTPQVSEDLLQKIRETVLQKTVDGMRQEGSPYVGVLYAGLMLTRDGPRVLEYNCRFGDPECQVLLPLLKSDLYQVIQDTIQGRLASSAPTWQEHSAAVTVVMASGGYPGDYKKGIEITGLSRVKELGLQVFHAGTVLKEGRVLTSGGRVLTVTAVNRDLPTALQNANKGVASVQFQGAVYRRDIGHRAIAFLQQPRGLTYKDSGVDIAAGNALVDLIKPLAAATARKGCSAELGGFAGLFDLKAAGYIDPILVSGTDGVGTKLKIAQECNKHDTLGQDLVAMCVNDILAQGAEPLFFLDYFSCGRLDVGVASSVIAGIAEACKTAGCALLDASLWKIPEVFSWLQREGQLSEEEMGRTFNCGLGSVLVVGREAADEVLRELKSHEEAWVIGTVTQQEPGEERVLIRNLLRSVRAGSRGTPVSTSLRSGAPQDCAPERRARVAVLISGTGTNLQALMEQVKKPWSSAEIVLVISSRPGVEGLKKAALAGIPTREEVDAGAIIVQEAVPVMVGDTEDSLSERVKEAEHRAFPAALELVASGTVRLGEDNKIHRNTQEQH